MCGNLSDELKQEGFQQLSGNFGLKDFKQVVERLVFADIEGEEIDEGRGESTDDKLKDGMEGELQNKESNWPRGKVGVEEEGEVVHQLFPNGHVDEAFGIHCVDEIATERCADTANGNGKDADSGTVKENSETEYFFINFKFEEEVGSALYLNHVQINDMHVVNGIGETDKAGVGYGRIPLAAVHNCYKGFGVCCNAETKPCNRECK